MSLPRPLFWISLAFLLGIALAGIVFLPLSIWLFLAVIALGLGILWRFLTQSLDLASLAKDVTSATIFLVVLFLGAARYQSAIPEFDAFDLAWYNDREYDVLITGWVAEPPDLRDDYANLRVRATGLDNGDGEDLEVNGLLLARADPNQTYEYGDILRLRGRLKTPPENEDFSYRDYLARAGIHAFMTSAEVTLLPGKDGNIFSAGLYALKQKALATVYRLFPDPEASLLAGILLGVDNGLPADLQKAFKDTGTAHIIAISGFNITIIAELFLSLFGRVLGPRRGALAAAIGIGFYTLLVGANAAVVRAAVMGLLALFARHMGRRQDGILTLFVVAAGMAFFNPFYLQDVGFQLSFAATLGLVLYAQPLEQFFTRLLTRYALRTQVDTYTGKPATRNPALPHEGASRSEVEGSQPATSNPQLDSRITQASSLISNFFLLTLAAQITTLPIMAYHFNRLSLVSFIANPFILPPQPAVMILGGLAVILGMIFQPLGQLAALVTWPFVTYTIRMVDFFAHVPGAAISMDFPFWGVIVWYAVLFGLTVGRVPLKEWIQRLRLDPPKVPAWGVLAGLTIAALLIWRAVLSIPDGKLHITFLDVGSSDAILIQTPRGGTVLVNGGESLSQLSSQLGERLPLFHRKLDWLVIASTQENQVASLPRLMDRYPPDRVLWTGNTEASYSARALDKWLTDQSVPVTVAEAGQTLDLGDGATLKVLTSGPRGSILLIEYRGFRALFPVGFNLDALTELQFGKTVGPFTLLLLADSGFAQLNPPEWIQFLDPHLVVLSVAADDINGLPDAETLEAVSGIHLLRTDENGWIEVVSDGQSIWVEVERGGAVILPTPQTETVAPTEPPATEAPNSTQQP
jgi:competence protein ComEC